MVRLLAARRAWPAGCRAPRSTPTTKIAAPKRSTHVGPAELQDRRPRSARRDRAADDADQREPRVREHELVRAGRRRPARGRSWRRPALFDSTSIANASGYSSQAVDRAGHEQAQHRPPAGTTPTMSRRRPPRLRSSSGPTTGATTANGAIVISRYKTTRPRAASGLAPKKIDSRERDRDEDVAADADQRARAPAVRTA